MASQNVLQLQQQTGSADPTSVLYAVKGGNTDTGLPLSVLFTSANLITPTTTNGTFTHPQIVSPTIAGGSADNISIGGLTPGPGSFTTLSATTPVAIVSGGTGATTASAARTNLGLGTAATANTGTSGAVVPLLNGANTWSAAQSFGALITPTSTIGIKGTATNDSAQAGSVGEFINNTATGVSMTSTIVANVTSISLTAGDWDVWGSLVFAPAGGTIMSTIQGSISTTSATQRL
jgi:hypothetical protein